MSVRIVTLSSLSSRRVPGAGRGPGRQLGLGNASPERLMFDELWPFRQPLLRLPVIKGVFGKVF